MLPEKLKTLGSIYPSDERQRTQREKFDDLCAWIESHLDESIGWQELMTQSGWDYQTIQTHFYRHKCTTAMTWIRLRRQAQTAPVSMRSHALGLREAKFSQP